MAKWTYKHRLVAGKSQTSTTKRQQRIWVPRKQHQIISEVAEKRERVLQSHRLSHTRVLGTILKYFRGLADRNLVTPHISCTQSTSGCCLSPLVFFFKLPTHQKKNTPRFQKEKRRERETKKRRGGVEAGKALSDRPKRGWPLNYLRKLNGGTPFPRKPAHLSSSLSLSPSRSS